MSDVPQPLTATLTLPLTDGVARVSAGETFGVSSFAGARQLALDLGNGQSIAYGHGSLPGYGQVGDYTLTIQDAENGSRQVVVPVQVDGSLAIADVSDRRDVVPGWRYGLHGAACPDNHFGMCAGPDGSILYFSNNVEGYVGVVQRSRGTLSDPFAFGDVVNVPIKGNPFVAPDFFWPGPVHVVQRVSKPSRLLMCGMVTRERPGDPSDYYGDAHWAFSDDWGLSWTYAGVAWEHAVSFDQWLADGSLCKGYLGAGSGLFPVGDLEGDGTHWTLLPVTQCNGPVFGMNGTADNFCPFGWARVPTLELCDALDRGLYPLFMTQKWDSRRVQWQAGYDQFASPVARFGGSWTPQVVYCEPLRLYLAIFQPGSAAGANQFGIAWSRDLFTWSPPQLLFDYDVPGWDCCYPTPVCLGHQVGLEFEVWFTEQTEGPPKQMRQGGFTVKLRARG